MSSVPLDEHPSSQPSPTSQPLQPPSPTPEPSNSWNRYNDASDEPIWADVSTLGGNNPENPTLYDIPLNPETSRPRPRAYSDDEEEEGLDDRAEIVVTILKPVSITMFLVLFAIKSIEMDDTGSDSEPIYIAYDENSSDSGSKKFGGALLNALLFVCMILVVTFIFVCLYKYRCTKVIFGWLLTSSALLLGMFGGTLFYLLLESYELALDYFSFAIIVWNFSIVGMVSMFWYSPAKLRQAYLIIISALMAIFFTRLPEWTTWAILAAIAVYDLFAVLCPGGPLKVLVETAQERQEPIPAFLYNSFVTLMTSESSESPVSDQSDGHPVVMTQPIISSTSSSSNSISSGISLARQRNPSNISMDEDTVSISGSEDQQPLVSRPASVRSDNNTNDNPSNALGGGRPNADLEAPPQKRKGVKLGLGDFVFYSVLIGRAAMFDILTVFACFIAIITGLFLTLVLLAIFKRALPALPISIFLGMIFFFVSKIFLLPVVVYLGARSIFM